ncbi:hypothetical protein AHAS_Ahas08G0024200 [Arachis hypogaea]
MELFGVYTGVTRKSRNDSARMQRDGYVSKSEATRTMRVVHVMTIQTTCTLGVLLHYWCDGRHRKYSSLPQRSVHYNVCGTIVRALSEHRE